MSLVSHNISTDATVQNMKEDYAHFVADGSCTSRQKLFHNVIHDKLLDIELDKVIIFLLRLAISEVFLLTFIPFNMIK